MAELNGVPVTTEQLKGLALINYGHFTSMRVDDRHIRGLSHHLERLIRDCRVLFDADLERETVRGFIRHAISGRSGSFVVRVTIFDPALELERPGARAEPNVLVTTRPAGALPAPPLRVQSARYVRDLPSVKHVGLLTPMWHRRVAQLSGFDDALFVDADSVISEGATWNIGFFDGERVIWPDAETLPGVTMRLIQQVHERTALGSVNLSELSRMQAAFATNTSVGVRAITAIDDVEFPADHTILEALRKEYEEIPAERL